MEAFMSSSPLFSGILTALVTPFHQDGSIDFDSFRACIDMQINAGVHGLVPCGTTGEAATLSVDERLQVIKACVEETNGRVPVVAGAGHKDTKTAALYQKQMKEIGVDGTLQVTPWYNKPGQDGLYFHFKEVVKSAPLPTILYNVPARCGVDLLPETVERLACDVPEIVAIKEATGAISRAQDILCRLHERRPDFSVLSGDDGMILGLLAIGGHGVISVISHLCAKELVDMKAAFEHGDLETAQRLSRRVSPLTPALFFRPNPVPVKAALARGGTVPNMVDHVRAPLMPLNEDDWSILAKELDALGFNRTTR